MAAYWSDLPPEMLENIAEKCLSMMNLKDFVMFSCVCSSWHRAAAFVKSTIVLQPQMPWLMLPDDGVDNNFSDDEPEDDDHDDTRNLFDLCNNKCYNVRLPQAHKRRCYGTGSEWIFMVGLDRDIHLFNPLTQELLALPWYNTFPHPPPEDAVVDDDLSEWFRLNYIERVIVLSRTSLLVVVIYGEFHFVAVATQKDTKWAPINLEFARDVAYSPSLGVMLFLEQTGHVKYCDLQNLYDTTDTNEPLSLVDYVLPPNDILEGLSTRRDNIYLLESFGDIFMARRNYHGIQGLREHTCDFNVYKLDMKTKKWKEVFDIGDVALRAIHRKQK